MRIAVFVACGILVLAVIIALVGDTVATWVVGPLYSTNSCHLTVAGRAYLSPTHCGSGEKNLCWSPGFLRSIYLWPPGRQLRILSLFGLSSVYVPRAPPGASPTFVLVPRGPCYVPYELSGGP
jgi:hypothetical protein